MYDLYCLSFFSFSCEVIRDRQSGDSLQYAFIEFADRKSCEEAYFKMDNVLIDDRRIHVDFSQSVAKMRWRGKGKGIQYFYDKDDEMNNENLEKVNLRYKQRDESRSNDDVISRKQNDKRYKSEILEHRKHERRKDTYKTDSEYSHNVEKYIEKEKYKEQRHRDNSRDRYEYDSRRRKGRKQKSRDKSRDRSRERSKKEGYKEHKRKKKGDSEKKKWDRESSASSNEDSRYEKHKERHLSHKRKHASNRSVEKYEKSEKHKQKRLCK